MLTYNDFTKRLPADETAASIAVFDALEVPALEQYNPARFVREYHVFRPAFIGNRISTIGPDFQLPYNSVVHILDDAEWDTHADTPRVSTHPMVIQERSKKWIYHVMDFDKEGPYVPDVKERYLYRQSGLSAACMRFKRQYQGTFRYITNLLDIPARRESLTVINHNPLFRAYLFGRLRYYRKFKLIFGSILNTVLKIQNKTQYICIPLTSEMYTKEFFMKSRRSRDLSALKRPDSFHWLFMMEFLNFVDTECQLSLFEKLPKDRLHDINFVLTVRKEDGTQNAIFYNLGDLIEMNQRNRYYLRIVNHINKLAASAVIPLDVLQKTLETTKDTPEATEHALQQIPETVTPAVSTTTDTEEHTEARKEEAVIHSVIAPKVAALVKPIVHPVTQVITDTKRVIERAAVPVSVPPVTAAAVPGALPAPRIANTQKTTVITPVPDVFIETLNDEADMYIDSLQDITPRQKERCKTLSRKYETLHIGGRPLKDILSTDDSALDTAATDKGELVKDLPDKSMRQDRVRAYAQSYLKKTYHKDIAAALVSFQKTGMYLTDITESTTVNELSATENYKCHYEDTDGKRHTVVFQFPQVDKDGICRINGTRKYMKNQMIALPLCKVSETRVSMSSNFNKTIIERNTTVAHSYLSYIKTLLGKRPDIFTVHYNTLTINAPLSYDYTVLATQYKGIEGRDIESKELRYYHFDYFNRFQQVPLTPEHVAPLTTLEKQYGTLCGRYGQKAYLFVDTNNVIRAVTVQGTLIDETQSFAEGILNCLPDDTKGKDKQLTEWTELKILDKQFPIIFILAYKYGLTETLKHLGVQYKVIGKRTTEIYEDPAQYETVTTEALSHDGMPDTTPKYFHITQKDLGPHPTLWAQVPAIRPGDPLQDAALPRLCVSTDIDGAVMSLYPTRLTPDRFKDGIPYLDHWVYGYAGPRDTTKLVSSEELTQQQLVHDAHITHECWITEDTPCTRLGCIRIYNKLKSKTTYTAFDKQYNGTKYTAVSLKWGWITQDQAVVPPLEKTEVPTTESWWSSTPEDTSQYLLNDDTYPRQWVPEGVFTDLLNASHTTDSKGVLDTTMKNVFAVCKDSTDIWYTKAQQRADVKKYCPAQAASLRDDYPEQGYKQKHFFDDQSGVFMERARKPYLRYKTARPDLYAYFTRHVGSCVYYSDSILYLLTQCKGITAQAAGVYLISMMAYVHVSHLLFVKEKVSDSIRYAATFLSYVVAALYAKTQDPRCLQRVLMHPLVQECIRKQVRSGGKYMTLGICHAVLDAFHLERITTEALNTTERYTFKPNDIVIKFKDCRLVFNRYPLAHSLIVSGLDFFDVSSYTLEEFDTKDVYYALLEDKGYRSNYLKGIDAFFAYFLDEGTKDVLRRMGEPTTVRDLMIRATVMLTTLDHKEASSIANHRIRGYEQMSAILYNEMSRQMAAYKVRRGKGNTFSLNPEAVYQRIIQSPSFAPLEEMNPIADMTQMNDFTYAGIGGRTSESFVVDDRRYPKDGVGVISEATVDNGKVAINATLSTDAAILNTRGMLQPREDPYSAAPAQVLSPCAALFPCLMNDDSKRTNFLTIQSRHYCATEENEVGRVRTGYERMVAHRTSSTYVGIARMNGKVLTVDDTAHLCVVQYADGTKETFHYGETYTEGSGFVLTQSMVLDVKAGQTFKQDEVICYNDKYFKKDPLTKQLNLCFGLQANVAFIELDGTLEDSTQCSKSFAKRLAISPAVPRYIELTADCIVHDIVTVGQHVYNTDPLLYFEEGEAELYGAVDEDTQSLLSKLNRKTPKAKTTGEIVSIKAYYSCPITEMSVSLQKIVKQAIAVQDKQAALATGTMDQAQYLSSAPLPVGTKYKGTLFEKDTVLLEIMIKEQSAHGAGDKLTVAGQLKSTTNRIMNIPPVTESGRAVDVIYSSDRAAARTVMSCYLVGGAATVLETVEERIVDLYFS